MSLQPAYKHIDEIGLWNDRAQQLECVSVVKEGRDVATFTFRAAEEGWFRYEPGQFVTLELPTPDGKASMSGRSG